MPSLNKIEIIGNVGSQPEMRFSTSGKPVTNFRVATNRRYTDSNGEKKEETGWFSVITWGKLAEQCNQFVSQGQLVYISGRVSLHTWQKQEGSQGSRLEINAYTVLFLSRPNSSTKVDKLELEPEDVPF